MAFCSTSKLVAAYMAHWIDWWPASESSAQGIWAALCNGGDGGAACGKEVKKVIGAAYLWNMWITRNNKVFKGITMNEKVVFENTRVLAFDWLRTRVKSGKGLC